MRSVSKRGGPGVEGAALEARFGRTLAAKNRLRTSPTAVRGAGVTAELKRASGECSPLQQICPGSGALGVAGVESWQPASILEATSAFAIGAGAIVQDACNKRAATATKTATLPVNRTIEPMPMYSACPDSISWAASGALPLSGYLTGS